MIADQDQLAAPGRSGPEAPPTQSGAAQFQARVGSRHSHAARWSYRTRTLFPAVPCSRLIVSPSVRWVFDNQRASRGRDARLPVERTTRGRVRFLNRIDFSLVSSASSVSSASFSSGQAGRWGSGSVGRRRLATPSPPRLFAVGLGRDLLQLAALHRRQGLTRRPLLRVAEGAAVCLDAVRDALDELPLPFGQGDTRLVGDPLRAFEGVQRLATRGLALGLERAGRGLVLRLESRPGLDPGRALE